VTGAWPPHVVRISYDFPSADYHKSTPRRRRRQPVAPAVLRDCSTIRTDLRRDPHPIVTHADTRFVNYGSYGVVDPTSTRPRAIVERDRREAARIDLGVSASYLGSHTTGSGDRLRWNRRVPGQRAVVALNGVSYANCTCRPTLDQRRVLHDPLIGVLDCTPKSGVQNYRGVKLSIRRREATASHERELHAVTLRRQTTATALPQLSTGYVKPNATRRSIRPLLAGPDAHRHHQRSAT